MEYKKTIVVMRNNQDKIFKFVKEYPYGALYEDSLGIKEFFTPYELGFRMTQVKTTTPRINGVVTM